MGAAFDRVIRLCYTRFPAHGIKETDLGAHDGRRALGRLGENLAAQHLLAEEYELVDRNWRCEAGEVDLVMRDGDTLVFVEVRTRRGQAMGSPEESITRAKQERLAILGEAYVQAADWLGDWRIDVVAILMDYSGHVSRLDHYENAVTG
jgi:putative endonuclease